MRKARLQFIRLPFFAITKRQKFILSVGVLSIALFLSEQIFGKSGFYIAFALSALASALFLLCEYQDIGKSFSLYFFALPIFLYTIAIELFYFLTPGRIITRLAITILYAIGLYSLYLSQNIFIVASLRTIPLLTGARIVTFVTTFFSYLLLTIVSFSLHLSLPITALLIFSYSFVAIFQSIAISFEKSLLRTLLWVFALSVCLLQISIVMWFWPANPTVIAIFLSVFFNTFVGLSRVWLEKRLFKGALWEYIWVAVTALFILLAFTLWRG